MHNSQRFEFVGINVGVEITGRAGALAGLSFVANSVRGTGHVKALGNAL